MWKRKDRPMKIYEYSIVGQASDAWATVSIPFDGDEFDVAEELAEKLYEQGDGDTHEEFYHGVKILVREKGSEKTTEFKIEVDYEPAFYVSEVK